MCVTATDLNFRSVVTAKNFGLQEENINISNPSERPLITKTGWGITERDRWTDGQMDRKREAGCSAL